MKYIENLIESDHIELVPRERLNIEDHQKFYLPHHPVLKEHSLTTKLRVVFNASRKSRSGISLNDKLLIGPRTQEDLFDVLIRWRKHRIVFLADIEKMYRQVKLIEDHRDYQRLLWRFNEKDSISEYRITTVIDGTASAQFLATRALQQLAKDMSYQYPEASQAILKDFYVDDLCSGSHDVESAKKIQNDLIFMMNQAGFILRKWFSNNQQLMENVPEEYRHEEDALIELIEKGIKTLGVFWNQREDVFEFKASKNQNEKIYTKRQVLSDIAKLFDPIGWLAPSTVMAKIFMQSLWELKHLSWDDPLPDDKCQEWQTYRNELYQVENIKVPRWIGTNSVVKVQFHGFSDASILAYAAVVYSRIILENGTIIVHIISSKTKVAPLRTITVPKLELCGCLLLASLITKIRTAFDFKSSELFLYSDSTTSLSWIQSHPNHYNVFVANRITEIQQLTDTKVWRYVNTSQNPADCATRGVEPNKLKNHHLWWTGPDWLSKPEELWPKQPELDCSTDLEKKKSILILHLKKIDYDYMSEILQKHSKLASLLKRTSYLLRWLPSKTRTRKNDLRSAMEIRYALIVWIKFTQSQFFGVEVEHCKNNVELPMKSKLIKLRPFIDEQGILRVGGRLSKSNLNYDSKHPIILPKRHHLTKLLIEQAHQLTLHGGHTLMLAFLSRYWIFGKSCQIKRVISRCVICFPYRCKPQQQIMADLPENRVLSHRAFLHSGVDFAGPINIKNFIGRSRGKYANTYNKSYIAIFVCLSTKAIHIEFVSDYTSVTFIAAFARFTARKGKVSDLYSDCGTNFVGANRILRSQLNKLKADPSVCAYFANDGTTWHFNPPATPHFGGLWEAGVKSIKYHLKRLVGNNVFTFEEMTTILSQIEACLNSRPLCPMNDDVNDNTYLTPGHFTIGEAPTTIPGPNLLDIKTNRLSRWNLAQQVYQQFWKYWSRDYLAKLQQRPKWLNQENNVRVGQLVLYREEDMPPTKWPVARVSEIHPGSDDNVRVVTLKMVSLPITDPVKYRILKRPITKVSVLPLKDYEQITEKV